MTGGQDEDATVDPSETAAQLRDAVAGAIGTSLYGAQVWRFWSQDSGLRDVHVRPVYAAADRLLGEDLLARAIEARFDQRLADVQAEHARCAEVWDRQRRVGPHICRA